MMQTSISIRELARLTGWDRKKISSVLGTVGDSPTLEDVVAAFVTAKGPAAEPGLFSQSNFARLTGLDRATVADRLDTVASRPGPKNSKLYALADALPALIAGRDITLDQVKLNRERHRERREEIELKKTLAQLVEYSEVRTELQEIFKALHRRVAVNFWREHAGKLKKAKTTAELARLGQDATEKIFDALRANYKTLLGSDQGGDPRRRA
jgi:transcriptional regulator with XRE-family HTH domain